MKDQITFVVAKGGIHAKEPGEGNTSRHMVSVEVSKCLVKNTGGRSVVGRTGG